MHCATSWAEVLAYRCSGPSNYLSQCWVNVNHFIRKPCSAILIYMKTTFFTTMHLKMSGTICRPFCYDIDVFIHWGQDKIAAISQKTFSHAGDKPLSETMMVNLLTHICTTRPQWVKLTILFHSEVAGSATICNCDAIHGGLFMSESMFAWFPTSRNCTGHIVCIVHDAWHLKTDNFLTVDAIQLHLAIT